MAPNQISVGPIVSGIATVNVVLDVLASFDILHTPDNTQRRIAWFSPYLRDGSALPAQDNLVCFLLRQENAEEALTAHPTALGLIVLEKDEAPLQPDDIKALPFARRLIVIRQREDSPSVIELQNQLIILLFDLYRWNGNCENIVNVSRSVQELLDVSNSLLGNWIDVNDATYTLVAHARNMEPPDSLSRNLVELGCHSALQVDAARLAGLFHEWRDQTGITIFEPSETVPFQHITYVMKANGKYAGHVVMVCNNFELTPGLIDLFEMFARRCESIIVGTGSNATAQAPYEGFLMHLLDNSSPSQDYIENQKTTIGLDAANAFCVVIIDNSEGSYSEQPALVLTEAKSTLPSSFIMSYEGAFLALFYAPDINSDQILRQAAELSRFCDRYECLAFESSVFTAIEDFAMAYRQAKATRKYRYAILNGAAPSPAGEPMQRVFFFADAFCCLVYDFENITDPLINYSLHHSQLDIIERQQADNEVSDLKILYRFLYNERRATPTAEELGMHRNNVLYRIKAIEQRYHFSLDDFSTRQYLLACFRMKINNSPQFRRQLL